MAGRKDGKDEKNANVKKMYHVCMYCVYCVNFCKRDGVNN